ncbi:cobalamin biosynthesis protein [Idiomarina aquatica]|uniref:Cobalamin biosynthesis protein n=1 Tax=Idiomarina aquatica TaxID=1327752 RepID=A0AA94EG76_9GAMM|nr:cobalamin biosynthesis protein [Idiomarina aquatica]RUO45291.1 cobalamin biosynthesis protein [Idiomarina aquatica]
MNAHDIQQILTSPWGLALIAIAIERWLPWPEQWHPVAIFRLFANYLQHKVNQPRYAPSQQRLAGALALLLLLLLTLVPTAIVVYAADLSQWLGTLVLVGCLRQQHLLHTLDSVEKLARKGQKRAARALLARTDWRDTHNLSVHGIFKTTFELRALSVIEHRYVPVLGWLLGGPILALALRVTTELYQLWPVCMPRFRHFGVAVRVAYAVTIGPVTLLLAMVASVLAALRRRPRDEPIDNNSAWLWPSARWLQALARLYNMSTGGPLQVAGQRLQRQRFAGRPPEYCYPRYRLWLSAWQSTLILLVTIALILLFIYRP